jgi:AcrR family transcriptional regulator
MAGERAGCHVRDDADVDDARSFDIDQELLDEVLRVSAESVRPSLPRHRHDLTRDEIARAQRARIIVATAEVVTEAGYHDASAKAIIQRAGVSSKTFYSLFEDKESAFMAGYTLLDGVFVQLARSAFTGGDGEPGAAVRDGFRAFLEGLAAWPLFARMHAVEGRAAGARALRHRTLVYDEFVKALTTALTTAREQDERISVPSEAVLMGVVGGIGELVLQHIVEEGPATLPDLLPVVVELFERVCFAPLPAG